MIEGLNIPATPEETTEHLCKHILWMKQAQQKTCERTTLHQSEPREILIRTIDKYIVQLAVRIPTAGIKTVGDLIMLQKVMANYTHHHHGTEPPEQISKIFQNILAGLDPNH